MPTLEAAFLLRIYLGENDRTAGTPTYEAIVRRAREAHLSGATVLRGPMGFGHNSRIHTAKLFRLSEDLPLVIEIVDAREKIEAFLAEIETLLPSGLVTLENVQVVKHPGAAR